MAGMAGAASLGEFASAIGIRSQESAIILELKAGSEDAYAWLVGEFHHSVYSVVYRILTDPADAADTTQEVFLKIFRGMKHFHGQSSLKTWIYRIAIHEASNRRRWWFRHKAKETSMEPSDLGSDFSSPQDANPALVDHQKSPFEMVADHELRGRVEEDGVWDAGFAAGFLRAAGFLGAGAVSSTTVFFGAASARAVCKAARNCPSSVSLARAIRSMRSANARRESCSAPKSRFSA